MVSWQTPYAVHGAREWESMSECVKFMASLDTIIVCFLLTGT
jgi:hypothetical protein